MGDRISRRRFVASTAMLGSAAFSGKMFHQPAAAQASLRKPNIIFIMADDLGCADLSSYGRRDYETPHIDKLAEQGMRFTQAYANSAVCTATRVGLITGRYQYHLPIGLEEPLGSRDIGLPPSHPTMPSLLKALGYETYLIGKWHMGTLPDYGPLKSGYDHFWGIRYGGVDYFTHELRGKPDLWDNDIQIREKGYLTDLLADRTIKELRSRAGREAPFFISLHFTAPHFPWEGPDDQAESARLKETNGFFHGDGGSLATYAKMVTRLDMQVGRIMAELERLGEAHNTIVIFTSDNGGERYSDTWPFTGKKTELLEGGLRIPAIVRWPGFVSAGSVSDQVMISMDWLPTLTAIAGGASDPAYPSDGMDITGQLTGRNKSVSRTLCWRFYNMNQEACRSGDWKYLKILGNSFLFNVVDDPLERANLKDRRPEKFMELKQIYDVWNAKMLPYDPDTNTHGFTGSALADHFGVASQKTVLPQD